MPDKIEKRLRKLSFKERQQFKKILLIIKSGKFDDLDIVKLKGKNDIYRLRKGAIRVIFRQDKTTITILTVERRPDTTYKNLR